MMNILTYSISQEKYDVYQERLEEIYILAEEEGRLTRYNEDLEVQVIKAVASLFIEFCTELCGSSDQLSADTLIHIFIEFVSNYTTCAQTRFCVQSVLFSRNPELSPPNENSLLQELRGEHATHYNTTNRAI